MKRKIINLIASLNNLLNDIIKINDNDKKIKFSKTKNDVKMIKNEYKKKNAKKNEDHEIITIFN